MNTQEYLGIISILKQARDLVNAVVDDLSDRSTAASDLRRVVADLERAIAAYQDKLKWRPRDTNQLAKLMVDYPDKRGRGSRTHTRRTRPLA
jgi:hypothetical protein